VGDEPGPDRGADGARDEGDREHRLEAGTDGHIAKPLQPGGLFETVEREGEPRTE